MIDYAHDLETVFFGPEVTTRFAIVRPGEERRELRLILGVVDDDALEARAMAAVRVAHFPNGKDVRADDKLLALEDCGPDVPTGTVFVVLDQPRRVNDGMEVQAPLGSSTL